MSEDEKPWDQLDDAAFREREAAFLASIRGSDSVGGNPYRDLDAALLSPPELGALERVLGGRGGSYDRSILRSALSRQIAGEAILGGQNE